MTNREKLYAVGTLGMTPLGEGFIESVTPTGNYYVRMKADVRLWYVCHNFFTPLSPSTEIRGGKGSGLFGPAEPLEEYNTEDDDHVPY